MDKPSKPGLRKPAGRATRPAGRSRDAADHTASYTMPTKLHRRLADIAKEEQRTVAAQLRVILQQWITDHDSGGKPSEED